MARILDNILPPTASRAVKLRQSYDWIKTEHDAIPHAYEEKKHLRAVYIRREILGQYTVKNVYYSKNDNSRLKQTTKHRAFCFIFIVDVAVLVGVFENEGL